MGLLFPVCKSLHFKLYSRILHILEYLSPAIRRFLYIRVFSKSYAGSLTLLFLLHNFKHY